MRRLVFIALPLLTMLMAHAESEVSCSFDHQPLTEALRLIEILSGNEVTINFSYQKLEDYTVTTTITGATPFDAVHQVVGFYPIKVSKKGSVIVVQPLIESHNKIIGRLVAEDGAGVSFASVHVLTADSAVVANGISNERGDFVIPVVDCKNLLIKASCLGYNTVCQSAAFGDIGNILMTTDHFLLNNISAIADKRVITTAGAITRIRVADTPYAQVGTLTDLINVLPISYPVGPVLNANTVYYLNGREIVDQNQLALLRSSDISTIIIDKSPGPQYPADASIVINITTLRSLNDNVYLNVVNTTDFRRCISDMPSVDFKMQVRKFTTQLSYRYENLKSKWDDALNRKYDYQGLLFGLNRNRTHSATDKVHRLNWNGEMQCGQKNKLGLYLYYSNTKESSDVDGVDIMVISRQSMDDILHRRNGIRRDDDTRSHMFSGALTYDFCSRWLSAHLSQGLLTSKQDFNGRINENFANPMSLRTENASTDYWGVNTNVDFTMTLPCQMSMTAGWRYSYVSTKNDKFYENIKWIESNYIMDDDLSLAGNLMSVKETDNQVYLAVNQRFGHWMIIPGLRIQWVNRNIKDRMNDYFLSGPDLGITNDKTTYYKKTHQNILPSLSVRFTDDDLALSLGYLRRIIHPAFHWLNSGVIYEDSLTLCVSNNYLKSTITDELRLSGAYRNFSADLCFTHKSNPIAEVEVMYVFSVSDLFAPAYRGPVNISEYNMLTVDAAYSSTKGRLTYYGSLGVNMPFRNTDAPVKSHPWINMAFNVICRLSKHYSCYIDYKLQTAAAWMVYERNALNQLNMGVNGAFCSNRLNIGLEATDLMASKHNGALTTIYGGTVSTKMSKHDLRGISLRVSYTIFNKPIRTIGTKANSDIIDRIE